MNVIANTKIKPELAKIVKAEKIKPKRVYQPIKNKTSMAGMAQLIRYLNESGIKWETI